MPRLWPILIILFAASGEAAAPRAAAPAVGLPDEVAARRPAGAPRLVIGARDDLAPPRLARGQRAARMALGPWAPDLR